jgi:hypothetical protein
LQRIKFNTPVQIVFRGLEIDSITSIDLSSGTVTGFFSLLREDGKRWRSIPFSIQLSSATENFQTRVLNRLVNQVEKIDGVDANLAGVVEDVPPGTPIP